jgi:hypothetical protein
MRARRRDAAKKLNRFARCVYALPTPNVSPPYARKVGTIRAITIITTTPSSQRIKAIVQAEAPLIFSPVCLSPVAVSHQP